jgi:hypothetical protein
MADYGERLEIHIYLVDGSKYEFFTDERPEIERIFSMVQPNRIFGQKQIMLAGTYFMGGFATDEITRVDLICDTPPVWPQLGGVKEVVEVDEEMMRRKAIPRISDPRRSDIHTKPGEMVDTFAEFGLADGSSVAVRMSLEVHGAIDQRSRAYNMFTGAGFHVNRRGGGLILINPRHVVRWTMYPGPAQTPATAWKAHRLDSKEWGGAPSMIFKKMDLDEDEDASRIPPTR